MERIYLCSILPKSLLPGVGDTVSVVVGRLSFSHPVIPPSKILTSFTPALSIAKATRPVSEEFPFLP